MLKRWIAFVLFVMLLGCDDESPSPDAGPDTASERKREVLASLGANVILPTYREFAAEAGALVSATEALAADPNEANRMAARDAWVAAMEVWQKAEVYPIGIAGMSGTLGVVGGMDLRDDIYSFPVVSPCRVDEETEEQAYVDVDAFARELVNVRGLDALEYLLFAPTTENACPDTHRINEDGSWAALSETEITARRAAYAHTLAQLIKRHADTLVSAWDPADGDFLGAFSKAGLMGSPFRTAQHALNDLTGQFIAFTDAMVKDMKIGEPAGILGCLTSACLDQLESPWARRSKEHVLVNLRSLQTIFLGGPPGTEALGLDDLLLDIGANDLLDRIKAALDSAIAAIEGLEGDLGTAITNDPQSVMDAFDELTTLARLLKSDLVTVLDIELPANFGDND